MDINSTVCTDCEELHQPHFILLNIAVGGGFTNSRYSSGSSSSSSGCGVSSSIGSHSHSGSHGGCGRTPEEITADFPATMYIDWVRIYHNGFTSIVQAPTPQPSMTPTQSPSLPSSCAIAVPGTPAAKCVERSGPGFDQNQNSGLCPANSIACRSNVDDLDWELTRVGDITVGGGALFDGVLSCTPVGTLDTVDIRVREIVEQKAYSFSVVGDIGYAITAVNLKATDEANFCAWAVGSVLGTDPLFTPVDDTLSEYASLEHIDLCVSRCDSESPTVEPTLSPSWLPSVDPTEKPSSSPSNDPTGKPFSSPSDAPSKAPSLEPTRSARTASPIFAIVIDTAAPSMTPSDCPIAAPGTPEAICTEKSGSDVDLHQNSELCPEDSVVCVGDGQDWEFAQGSALTLGGGNLLAGTIPCTVVDTVDMVYIHVQEFLEKTAYSFKIVDESGPSYAMTAVNLKAGNKANLFTWAEGAVLETDTLLTPINPNNNKLFDLSHVDICVQTCFADEPSVAPSSPPSQGPSWSPTSGPSYTPSLSPTQIPSSRPSSTPSENPTAVPSSLPTSKPSLVPTSSPTTSPSNSPSMVPTGSPTMSPSVTPSKVPTFHPTTSPTSSPNEPIDCLVAADGVLNATCVESPQVPTTICPEYSFECIGNGQNGNFALGDAVTLGGGILLSGKITCTVLGTSDTVDIHVQENIPQKAYSFEVVGGSALIAHYAITTINLNSNNETNSCAWDGGAVIETEALLTPVDDQTNKLGDLESLNICVRRCDLTARPTSAPTLSVQPTVSPSYVPSFSPTNVPTLMPSESPSTSPTRTPSVNPTQQPSRSPSAQPTDIPSSSPSVKPSVAPSSNPSTKPSVAPSPTPSTTPTMSPTVTPSVTPTENPTAPPSSKPSASPTKIPPVDCALADSGALHATCVERSGLGYDDHENSAICPAHSVVCVGSGQDWEFAQGSALTLGGGSLLAGTISCTVVGTSDVVDVHVQELIERKAYSFKVVGGTSPVAHYSITAINLKAEREANFCTWADGAVVETEALLTPVDDSTGKLSDLEHADICVQRCDFTPMPSTNPTVSLFPTSIPTAKPSVSPSDTPTIVPSSSPSSTPTSKPSVSPSYSPTSAPSSSPSSTPTSKPSVSPSYSPTSAPTESPSSKPSDSPSNAPSIPPTTAIPTSHPLLECPIAAPGVPHADCVERSGPGYDEHQNSVICPGASVVCVGSGQDWEFAQGSAVTLGGGVFLSGILPCTVEGTSDVINVHVREFIQGKAYSFKVLGGNSIVDYAITAVNMKASNEANFCTYLDGAALETEALLTPLDDSNKLRDLGHIDICVNRCDATKVPTAFPSSEPSYVAVRTGAPFFAIMDTSRPSKFPSELPSTSPSMSPSEPPSVAMTDSPSVAMTDKPTCGGKGGSSKGSSKGKGEPSKGKGGKGEPSKGSKSKGKGEPSKGSKSKGKGEPSKGSKSKGKGEPSKGKGSKDGKKRRLDAECDDFQGKFRSANDLIVSAMEGHDFDGSSSNILHIEVHDEIDTNTLMITSETTPTDASEPEISTETLFTSEAEITTGISPTLPQEPENSLVETPASSMPDSEIVVNQLSTSSSLNKDATTSSARLRTVYCLPWLVALVLVSSSQFC